MREFQPKLLKLVKVFSLILIIYFISGIVLGFIGVRYLRCKDPHYQCVYFKQYISDSWLIPNTLLWPFGSLDDLDKADIIF